MAVKQVPGVLEAEFSYERGEGTVTYDSAETRPEVFIDRLAQLTGFGARVTSASSGDQEGDTPADTPGADGGRPNDGDR